MKRLGIFLLPPPPPGWNASPWQGYPIIEFASTHLYTLVERGTVRVKRLTQEHSTMSSSIFLTGVPMRLFSLSPLVQNKVSFLPEPFIYAPLHRMNILQMFVLNRSFFAVPKNVCKLIALYKADSKI